MELTNIIAEAAKALRGPPKLVTPAPRTVKGDDSTAQRGLSSQSLGK